MRALWMMGLALLVACGSEEPVEAVIRPVRTLVPSAMQGELERTFRGAVPRILKPSKLLPHARRCEPKPACCRCGLATWWVLRQDWPRHRRSLRALLGRKRS